MTNTPPNNTIHPTQKACVLNAVQRLRAVSIFAMTAESNFWAADLNVGRIKMNPIIKLLDKEIEALRNATSPGDVLKNNHIIVGLVLARGIVSLFPEPAEKED